MKAAFIHDHNFVISSEDNRVFDGSGGAFDENLWKRYLEIFESLVVVGRKVNKLPNKLVLSSANNVRFSLMENLNSPIDRLFNMASVKKKLRAVIESVDFVVIRLPSTLGYWAFSICISLKKKYVLEIVGDPFEAYWNYGNLVGKIIAPIEAMKLKRTAGKSYATIYVTKEYLQNKYPTGGLQESISNVRLEEVLDFPYASQFYERPSNMLRIGLIGSFHVKYKGHYEALKAIKHIKETQGNINFKLLLVGTGDSSWIESLAKEFDVFDHIEFVGALKVGKDGIFPFLDSIHLYIHPSKTEGLPRVVIEAMSRGRICLASSVGGTPELLNDEFTHKPGDWRRLSDQILDIHNMEASRKVEISTVNLRNASSYLEDKLQKKRSKIISSVLNNKI